MSKPRVSEAVHALRGTKPQYSALDESHVAGTLPKAPKHLDKEERKKFKQMVRQLADRRAVTSGDADVIAIYVEQHARWQQSLAKLKVEGNVRLYIRLDSNGEVHQVEKPNIHLAIAKDCERAMVVILSRLGLTPKDREIKPTAPTKPRNAPPHPDSIEGMKLEEERLRKLVEEDRRERATASEPESVPDLNSPELNAAMERIV